LGFVFSKTGGHQGQGALFISGKKAGEGTIARTVPIRNSISEGLEIGRDTTTPVEDLILAILYFMGYT
jgi:hypothetical protein